jgi:hypothetical protein
MYSLLGFLLYCTIICHAAVLPSTNDDHLHRQSLQEHNTISAYSFNTERRDISVGSLVVNLELVGSGYCGNISIGSQDKSIVTLFDLNTSQLSALSSNLQYCPESDQCSTATTIPDNYDPDLSDTAVNSSESFQVSVLTSTLTGVVYEDSVSIGGNISLRLNVLIR